MFLGVAAYPPRPFLQICERSLSGANGETTVPAVSTFVRGEVLTGGFLLRPCDGGGCILIAVDHVDMEVGWTTGSDDRMVKPCQQLRFRLKLHK